MNPLTPECRIVFASAHVAPDVNAIRALLKPTLDWGRILRLAERERATSTLSRVLGAAPDGMPPGAVEHLRRTAMVQDFRMLRLAARLKPALAALETAGVPVMLLKGAALAATVYDGFVTRAMTDVDLLIRPEDVPRARDAIITSGWPETTDPVLLTLLQDQHHLPHFVDPEPTGLRIELHTHLLPTEQPFAIEHMRYWEGARHIGGEFGAALVADREALLLHACLHFAWSHSMTFGGWRTFRDVTALIRDEAFDWDRFVARAQATKGLTCCYWTLRLAERMSGATIPPTVLERLSAPMGARTRRILERHFITGIAPGEAPPCPSIKLERALWLAALRPKWSGHARAGRFDPEHRWERARGTASTETLTQRLARHAAGIRHWWDFAIRTLAPFDRT